MKIGKKRKYEDVRRFVEMEAQSSDEEEEEFAKEKGDQYYKPGELVQKTKKLNLTDLEEKYRHAAEMEQKRQEAIDKGE